MKKIKELSVAKKVWLTIVLIPVVIVAVFSGCNNSLHVKFPNNPIKFETYTFLNPDNNEDEYLAFDYNERTYIGYANQNKTISKSDLGSCLGNIIYEGKDDTEVWLVQLKALPNDDILMMYYPYAGMQPPIFFRAIDTRGQTLDIPDYIDAENCDDYWKE